MTKDLATKPEQMAPPLVTLRSELEARAEEFRMALPSHISPEKFQRTILTAVQVNPDLLACDRRSLLTAVMKAAQDGLLPDGREAAIVKFDTRMKDAQGRWASYKLAQYMPMIFGLRKKILQSGEVVDLFAGLVYRQEIEAGAFVYEEGTERQLRHKPIVEPSFRPTDDDIALAYSIATYADGSKSFEVMRRYEIDDIREASSAGATVDRKGEPRDPSGPWVEWFGEMAKKSVTRRHAKVLPQSGDVVLRDVEAEDMGLAARSALALLGSRPPDAPARSIDHQVARDPEPDPVVPDPEPEPVEEDDLPGDAPEDQLTEPPEAPPIEPEVAAEPPVDDLGITVDPAETLANDLITRAKGCELLIDLTTLEREADLALAEMPPEIARFVDEAFAEARGRLTPPERVLGATDA